VVIPRPPITVCLGKFHRFNSRGRPAGSTLREVNVRNNNNGKRVQKGLVLPRKTKFPIRCTHTLNAFCLRVLDLKRRAILIFHIRVIDFVNILHKCYFRLCILDLRKGRRTRLFHISCLLTTDLTADQSSHICNYPHRKPDLRGMRKSRSSGT
jgi:hypothetical protein